MCCHTVWPRTSSPIAVNIARLDDPFDDVDDDDGGGDKNHGDGNDDLLHVFLCNRTVREIFPSPFHPPKHL